MHIHISVNNCCVLTSHFGCVLNSAVTDVSAETSVVMCHQSKWQQHILLRYGNETCLLDATYNTTIYDLPLYMLCCLTNSGYVVIASFLLTDDTAESIQAGLRKIAGWNPDWKPRAFMSDFSESQITAIETVFPGNAVTYTFIAALYCLSVVAHKVELAVILEVEFWT
jgi:hypothetical protein